MARQLRLTGKKMIFSVKDHIDQIKQGTKTQTRRPNNRYKVGKIYAIQPKRGVKAIPEGRIRITKIVRETRDNLITIEQAIAEGGYNREEYERLYEKMYRNWRKRYAFYFEFVKATDVN